MTKKRIAPAAAQDAKYGVYVGKLGWMYWGNNRRKALEICQLYRNGGPLCNGESVTFMHPADSCQQCKEASE